MVFVSSVPLGGLGLGSCKWIHTSALPQSLGLHLGHPQLTQSHMRLEVRQTQGLGLSNLFTEVIVMGGE